MTEKSNKIQCRKTTRGCYWYYDETNEHCVTCPKKEAKKKCWQCKYRLRRLTGKCYIMEIASQLAPFSSDKLVMREIPDDIYGCNSFEPLEKK